MTILPPSLEEWKSRGNFLEIDGHSIFYIDEGRHEEVIAILHGYPTCSYDYYKVLPLLTKKYRVICHDHLGFGLSDRPFDYSYSLIEQADLALALWQKLGLKKVHLLAHDYGTSVATEIVARSNKGYEPVFLDSVTLGNGSMHIEMAQLLLIQKLLKSERWGPIVARISTKFNFNRNMKKIWYDKSKIVQEELDVLYEMLWYKPEGRKVFHKITQYIDERYKFWHRWIGGLHKTRKRVNLLWADKDPIAVIQMAHVLHQNIPNSRLKVIRDCGHYVMLEEPLQYAKGVLLMLDEKD